MFKLFRRLKAKYAEARWGPGHRPLTKEERLVLKARAEENRRKAYINQAVARAAERHGMPQATPRPAKLSRNELRLLRTPGLLGTDPTEKPSILDFRQSRKVHEDLRKRCVEAKAPLPRPMKLEAEPKATGWVEDVEVTALRKRLMEDSHAMEEAWMVNRRPCDGTSG